jgi:hypothetical protein
VNGYGIIEVKDWSELLDAIAIIRQSEHWDAEEDDKPLMEWFRKLLSWMMASHKVWISALRLSSLPPRFVLACCIDGVWSLVLLGCTWGAASQGNIERHHHNNHAVWFYQTAMSIALHVGDVYTARLLAYDVNGMVDHQIMRDGTLPLELERPRKIHYTCYAMTAFYRYAMWHLRRTSLCGNVNRF